MEWTLFAAHFTKQVFFVVGMSLNSDSWRSNTGSAAVDRRPAPEGRGRKKGIYLCGVGAA